MRKPEPEIFHHTLDLLGVEPAETVFVDDLPFNIQGAADVGIVGVLHTSYGETVAELETLFGMPLRRARP
jgi:putative hydrolase of the HAD superfamily